MRRYLGLLLLILLASLNAEAVILDSTGDPAANTTAPGGALSGSGWQYEGQWLAFLGTAIAPHFFITAAHVGGNVGDPFTYNGNSYSTVAVFDSPTSDLRIWQVSGTFATYAPLYTETSEIGRELVVFGRGTQRGGAISPNGQLAGWAWGNGDSVERWGTNIVSAIVTGGSNQGDFVVAAFDHGFDVNEAHLSTGDSGGGVFVQNSQSQWQLAGINYAVDGPYAIDAAGNSQFNAALFDQSEFYLQDDNGAWIPATGPGHFYATRISSNAAWIQAVLRGAPVPQSVVSRKTHGEADNFDIPLPLTGAAGIECRRGSGANSESHDVVVTFASPVTVGGVSVKSSDGLAAATVAISGNTVTISLANVADAQLITISLTNLIDDTHIGNIAIPMGILLGDTNADGFVNSGDTVKVRSLAGQPTSSQNFRADINTDGFVNGGDAVLVRSHSGSSLP
jgi:hypothetical protein